jgi:chromosome partitioning protein
MATHEPDRSTRRRWFRMSPSQQSRSEPAVDPDESHGDSVADPPESVPDRDEPEAPVPTDTPAAPAHPAAAPTVELESDSAGTVSVAQAETTPPAAETVEPEEEPDPGPTAEEIAASMTLPRVISIANQKGGVGKTTTAVNLGAALAEIGYRVLVVDLDPQGNATTGLGISHRNVEGSIYDVIMNDTPVDDCVEPTSVKNLFVCPATIDLAGAEIELVPAFSRELKLKRALQGARDDYDFTLIDCPPSLGLLTVNGLAASDDVIVPIQCEYYALEGLGQLLRNVALVKSNLNPELEVRGIVLTMYDAGPDSRSRSNKRCGSTSARRCTGRSSPARFGSPRRLRSVSRSSCSTRHPAARSRIGSWPRR